LKSVKSIVMYNKKINVFVLIMFVFAVIACTKTEAYEPEPNNRILEFKITNLSDTVLFGAIDNIDNTITVYIPFYYGMSVIDPEIKLENGAVLKGEILPVSVKDTTHTYTVISSEGLSRTYKLVMLQKSDMAMNLFISTTNIYPESLLTIMGDFMSTSTETLEMFFVNKVTKDTSYIDLNKPVSIELNTTIRDLPHSYLLRTYLRVEMDSGQYDIHLTHLGRTEVVKDPLRIQYRPPTIASVWSPITVKPGGEIGFNPGSGRLLIDPRSVQMTLNGNTYDLTILPKSNRKMIYVQLPADVPAGNYTNVPFVFKFGEWNPVNANFSIIISAE
jgi:hypothetical protein